MNNKGGRLPQLRPLCALLIRGDRSERILEFPFVIRGILRRHGSNPNRPRLVIGYGFEYGKRRLLRRLWPDRRFIFLPMNQSAAHLKGAIAAVGRFEPWVWSFRDLDAGLDSAFWSGNTVTRVEDGFIRSVGLGAQGAPTHSFCLDRTGIYFDGSGPSDLENLANDYDLAGDRQLRERGDLLLERLLETGLSKYNFAASTTPDDPSMASGTVLVIGQVEDDQSIRRNRCALSTNEALLARAITDNPDRRVVFRGHPDVTSGTRPALSRPERLLPDFEFDAAGRPLADSLAEADTVYTISSLAGFEALMRGKRVRTFGAPFYAGWGLTEDALAFPRRTRRRSLVELLSLAYLVYPIYFNPKTAERLTAFEVIDRLEESMAGRSRGQ